MNKLLGKFFGTILAFLAMTLLSLCIIWLILRVSRAVNTLIGGQATSTVELAHLIALPAA